MDKFINFDRNYDNRIGMRPYLTEKPLNIKVNFLSSCAGRMQKLNHYISVLIYFQSHQKKWETQKFRAGSFFYTFAVLSAELELGQEAFGRRETEQGARSIRQERRIDTTS